jgi:hypothetical protein
MHLLYLSVLVLAINVRETSSTLIYEFTTLDWDFPNDSVRADYIARGEYVVEECQLSGLKVGDHGAIFVTAPRLGFKNGVPASLNIVRYKCPGSKEAILVPYPDWESNTLENCNNLILPMSIAIDPR